jgi:uncharacterized protein (DUF2267 family)
MMESISDVISNKADDLFEPPNTNTPQQQNNQTKIQNSNEEILNLEEDEVRPSYNNDPGLIKNETEQELTDYAMHLENEESQDLDIKTEEVVEDNIQTTKQEIDIDTLKTMVHSMKDQLDAMLRFIDGEKSTQYKKTNPESEILDTGERIIEGYFDGEKMIGPDGKEYSVPPNYASKSKLVEGDKMKLTITKNGKFIYKQIMQIDRKRLSGELFSVPDTDQWYVLSNEKKYKILTASVTFYKGKSGDEVIFLVAKEGESSWGAVENIIHKDASKTNT